MRKKIKFDKKWKRVVFRLSLSIVICIVVIMTLISPITKYVIEKYDVKFLGREITLDWAYVNPFTGYIHFDDLKVFEAKSDSVFFSVDGISVNITMYKLLSKTYEISSLTLDTPKGTILRTDNVFNFNDIIEKFSDSTPKKDKEPIHFSILDITIKNGEFYYKEPNTPIDFSFLKVNFNSDGKYWDNDTLNGRLSLLSGVGSGLVKASFLINLETQDYNVVAQLKDLNLDIVNQYLKDLADFGHLSGKVTADVKATGNFKNQKDLDGMGFVILNDIHFGKDPSNDYVAFKKLTVAFKQIAPAKEKFFFDTIRLENPVFKYEKYDHLDNLQKMFGQNGSKIKAVKNDPEKFNLIVSVADYINNLFKNIFDSDYKVNSLAIVDANITYNDFSTNTKFSASLNPLNIRADSMDNKKKLLNIYLKSGIQPYGSLSVTISVDPRTNKDFNLNYELRKVPVTLFNPYIITYSSFPLDRGKIELFGNWKIHNNQIQSNNHLIIIDPRTSKRIRKKDTKWLPIPLIMSIVRERGNVIDYEIPITGSLKNPKFHFADPIIDAIENIFIKPATIPYRFNVKNTEKEIEKSLSLTWRMRQTQFNKKQEKFLGEISDFLKDNPEAKIVVHPMIYNDKEKEAILFYEAKKKYYLSNKEENKNNMIEDDSLAIEKLSSKDSLFIEYLNKKHPDTSLFTVQEKCYRLVGAKLVNKEFIKLVKHREKAFMNYFEQEETANQIKLLKSLKTIPFNGFSYFKIRYDGDIPEALKDAFQKIIEYNNNAPRNEYKEYRKRKS